MNKDYLFILTITKPSFSFSVIYLSFFRVLFANLIRNIGIININNQNAIIIGIHESVVGSLLEVITFLSIGKEAKLWFISDMNIIKSKNNFLILFY